MNLTKAGWIDLSMPIYDGMLAWPTDPKVEVSSFKSLAKGARSNVSLLKLGSHTGTHMDAPRHAFDRGRTIDAVPLESLIGPVRVIEIKDRVAITAAELKKHAIRKGQRVFFKTRNSSHLKKKDFVESFVYVALDAAEFLVSKEVKLIGVDYLSIGGYGPQKDGVLVHQAILGKKICVVEGLNFSMLSAGWYDMICLPLRLFQGDGAPSRVIVRPRKN